MTQRDTDKHDHPWNVAERERRLAQARLAFDRGLREASEQSVRAARRLLVPALWGAAVVGGTLLAVALVRALRRPPAARALLRVSIEPRLPPKPLWPALGSAVARFAVQRLLASPGPEALEKVPPTAPDNLVGAPAASGHSGASNGRAQV